MNKNTYIKYLKKILCRCRISVEFQFYGETNFYFSLASLVVFIINFYYYFISLLIISLLLTRPTTGIRIQKFSSSAPTSVLRSG